MRKQDMIKDVKKILAKRNVYREISTNRKLNRMVLHDGRSVIPDVIAKTYDIANEYYAKMVEYLVVFSFFRFVS